MYGEKDKKKKVKDYKQSEIYKMVQNISAFNCMLFLNTEQDIFKHFATDFT